MLGFSLSVFRLVRFLMSGDAAIAIENAALRLQLAAFQRKRKRPVLTSFDRLFWVRLFLVWNGWRAALVYVQPDTVVRWQRAFPGYGYRGGQQSSSSTSRASP